MTKHDHNEKPGVTNECWRGVGNAIVFALILWAILFLVWLA